MIILSSDRKRSLLSLIAQRVSYHSIYFTWFNIFLKKYIYKQSEHSN